MPDIRTAFEKVGIKSEEKKEEKVNGQAIPKDYVEFAERVMIKISEPSRDGSKRDFKITTSKIRNILSLVTEIDNMERLNQEDKLSQENLRKIQLMKVRILYEAGRTKEVKSFVIESKILEYINGIGESKEKFKDFVDYMEALVAYHRYLGGRD